MKSSPSSSGVQAAVWLFAVVIQFGCQQCFSGKPLEISTPELHEQRLRHLVVGAEAALRRLSGLLGIISLRMPQSIVMMAFIVSNTFGILRAASGSLLCAVLISILLLFDQATLDLVAGDSGFAVQMFLVTYALLAAQAGSFAIIHTTLSLCLFALAVLLRFEAWPFGLPIFSLIVANLWGRGLFGLLYRAVAAFVAAVAALVVTVHLIDYFSTPLSVPGGMDLIDPLIEISRNPHNVALFGLVVLAVVYLTFSTCSRLWAITCFVGAYAVLYQSVGCVVNDWLVRVVLAKYLLLLGTGSIICNGPASLIGFFLVGLIVPVAFYFYLHPVQGGERK